jgi:hypothetical protein
VKRKEREGGSETQTSRRKNNKDKSRNQSN